MKRKTKRLSLTAQDHTKIVKAVMENQILILKRLGIKDLIESGRKLTAQEILGTLSEISEISDDIRSRVLKALQIIRLIDTKNKSISASDRDKIGSLKSAIEKESSISRIIELLESELKNKVLEKQSKLHVGVKKALAILRNGTKNIYSEKSRRPYIIIFGLRLAKQDAVGAINTSVENPPKSSSIEDLLFTFGALIIGGAIKSSVEEIINIFLEG